MLKDFLRETKWLLIVVFTSITILGGNVYWFATLDSEPTPECHAPTFDDPSCHPTPTGLEIKKIGEHLYTITGNVMEGDCEKIVSEIPGQDEPFTVILESPGGSLPDGACLAGHFKIRNVITVVRDTPIINEDGEILYEPGLIGIPGDPNPDGKVVCASSCTLMWLGGDLRYLIGNVWLGIHGPKTPDAVLPEVSKRALEASAYRTSGAIMMMLDSLGVEDDQIKYMFVSIPATSMYWVHPRDFDYKPQLKDLATHFKDFWGFTYEGAIGAGTND